MSTCPADQANPSRRWLSSAGAWSRARFAANDSLTLSSHLAALVLSLVFATPLLTGRVPLVGDCESYFIPIRAFYADCLAQGHSFDWMPQIFCGFDLTGEGQLGSYHPARWLCYRWLPIDRAFALEAALPFPLLYLGMLVFLRRFVVPAAAAVGALLFAFSSFVLSMGIWPHVPAVLAHVPWMLVAIDAAMLATDWRRRAVCCAAIALLTGSQILLGHPQMFTFSMLIACAFIALWLVQRRPRWTGLGGVALGMILGASVGAVQLLASYDALRQSVRAETDTRFSTVGSFSPSVFVDVFVPAIWWKTKPSWASHYFGAVPLILLFGYWTLRRPSARQSEDETAPGSTRRRISQGGLTCMGLLLMAFAIDMSLGGNGLLYGWQSRLPILGSLRCPHRYIVIAQFGLAVIGAIVFMRLMSPELRKRPTPWRRLCVVWLPVIAAIVAAIYFSDRYRDVPTRASEFAAKWHFGPAIFAAAALSFTLAARGHRIGLGALILIAALDSGLYGLGNPRMKPYWHKTPRYSEWLAATSGPPTSDEGRIRDGWWNGNRSTMVGSKLTNGYAGLMPAIHLDYSRPNALRVSQTAWACFWERPADTAGMQPRGDGWWRIVDPLPRVRLVAQCRASEQPALDIEKMDVDTTALVTHAIELTPGEPGEATLVGDQPGDIRVDVHCPSRQLMVLSERFHSGWKAFVDGVPASVERVNGDFMGCVVEPGKHEIQFAYAPFSLALGRFVSLGALTICLGLLSCAAWVPRREGNDGRGGVKVVRNRMRACRRQD